MFIASPFSFKKMGEKNQKAHFEQRYAARTLSLKQKCLVAACITKQLYGTPQGSYAASCEDKAHLY